MKSLYYQANSVGHVLSVIKWLINRVTSSAIAGEDSLRSLDDMLTEPTDLF